MLVSNGLLLPLGGFLVGCLMGFIARRHHFCTMAALERHWYAGDSNGLRAWALAIAVAIALTQGLAATGLFDPRESFYLSPSFGWTGAIAGGLAFGFGMALVGTCGFGALVRVGGGSLRSVVVMLVLGLSALAAQRGLIGYGRVAVVDGLAFDITRIGASDQSLGSILSVLTGADLRLATAVTVAGLLAFWVFRSAEFRRDRGKIIAGTAIGFAVAAGWAITSYTAGHAFVPVQIESASFVVPPGDLILHLITFTGTIPDYGVGLVAGVIVGAAAAAWRRQEVRWEACDDARELSRHLAGAFLMGTGGVFALGCTIGQGVSAASLLSVSAPVVLVSIAVGARLGLALLLEGSVRHAFWPLHRARLG
ncbi:YeeE/YedE family protein [Skermanella rosea]|uniref:YeeE/YedE family protein n=1 Tax=Skermanella rosea TaxID=1817965 RepID=UPI0019317893|nr:YeeE/YedE family protein [Skermanella rosea]UEM02473.1 YeeE/YedE family protein [Skermanella rosea]